MRRDFLLERSHHIALKTQKTSQRGSNNGLGENDRFSIDSESILCLSKWEFPDQETIITYCRSEGAMLEWMDWHEISVTVVDEFEHRVHDRRVSYKLSEPSSMWHLLIFVIAARKDRGRLCIVERWWGLSSSSWVSMGWVLMLMLMMMTTTVSMQQ